MTSIHFKTVSVSILTDPTRQFHFDYSGRLIGHFNHGDHYRIGLDGTILFKSGATEADDRFLPMSDAGFWWKEWLAEWESWRMIPETAWSVASFDTDPLPVSEFLHRIVLFARNLPFFAAEFSRIWGHIPILPPEFYQSVVVNFSLGCSYDDCTFCSFYKDKPFQIRNIPVLTSHLSDISGFFGDGISARRDIFIGEANALAIPNRRLILMLETLKDWIRDMKALQPGFRVSRIGSFVDGFTGLMKEEDEWNLIREAGVTDIAIGIESGNELLMEAVGKPGKSGQFTLLVNRLKASGFSLQLIFLLGLGGKKFRDGHFSDSMEMISTFGLDQKDRIQLSVFNPALSTGKYPFLQDLMSPAELDLEYLRWKNELTGIRNGLPARKYPTQFFLV